MFPKTPRVLDKKYRRLVASLPCVMCGVENRSQAAHPRSHGRGMKAHDTLCVPLCADSLGIRGCHSLVDQSVLGTVEEIGAMFVQWDIETKAKLGQR